MSDSMLDFTIETQVGEMELQVSEQWGIGVTGLFGPSGSGKTSLLRIIAGFTKPKTGKIAFAGSVWTDTTTRQFRAPHKRPVGFVHQGGHLLPHLSVLQNLQFANTRAANRAPSDASRMPSIDEIVTAFELDGLLVRKPETLSGGERQRIALAQSLLGRPKLLLLDEPLSALDQKRKTQLLAYLNRLQKNHPLPIIYVSHDVAEISQVANHVAIMDRGKIIDRGETIDVLNRHGFQTGSGGRSGTLLAGTVSEHDEATELMGISIGPHKIKLPMNPSLTVGDMLRIIVHASDVVLSTQAPVGLSVQNTLTGTIASIDASLSTPMATVMISLDGAQDVKLAARITRAAVTALSLREGQSIHALIKTAVLAR